MDDPNKPNPPEDSGEFFDAEVIPNGNGTHAPFVEAYDLEEGSSGAGRKKRVLTPKERLSLSALCRIQCTFEEICAVMAISKKTLVRMRQEETEIRRIMDDGYSRGRVSLRRHLFRHAERNVAAAIFLSKNLLGYRDVSDPNTNGSGGPIELSHVFSMSPDERRARIAELEQRRSRLLESA